jgi:type II secretory pathway pseudopilin PulG
MGTKNYQHNSFSLRAFTLIELLIVTSIIIILAIITIAYFRGQIFKGNDARRRADIDRMKIAVEEYEKDHNCYPLYVTCGIIPTQPIYPYLNNVPCDPVTNASYFYEHENDSCPGWYRFYSVMDYVQDPTLTPGIGPNSAFNYVSGSPNSPVFVSGWVGSPTPHPTGVYGGPQYYGCRNGACVPILWNQNRPGPECDPSFQDSNCYGQCGPPGVECLEVY